MAQEAEKTNGKAWRVIARKPGHSHVSHLIDTPAETAEHAARYEDEGYRVEVWTFVPAYLKGLGWRMLSRRNALR